MAMRNQTGAGVKGERVIMPEDERKVSRGPCVPRAYLPQVSVVDQETTQAQQDRRFQALQVKANRSSERR